MVYEKTALPSRCAAVIPQHKKKGNIPAITKPAEITPLVQAISNYKSPITRAGEAKTAGDSSQLELPSWVEQKAPA